MSRPLAGAIALALLCLVAAPAPAVADRDPGRSPFGIYGTRWAPWILENASTPGFHLYQLPYEPAKSDLDLIAEIAREGIEIIAVQNLYPSNDERFMRPGYARRLRPAESAADRIVRTLLDPRMAPVTAITLDEENLWVRGRGRYLSAIYRSVKDRLPGARVWQWFVDSPTRRDPVEDRYRVPADGYVFDAYHLPSDEYERRVALYAARGEPVVSILWASPSWVYGQRSRGRQPEWWDAEGWRELYARVLVNRRHGVRTAFFMYDVQAGDPGARLVPSFAGDSCSRAFVRKFFDETLPRLAALEPDAPVPERRPGWFAGRCPAG